MLSGCPVQIPDLSNPVVWQNSWVVQEAFAAAALARRENPGSEGFADRDIGNFVIILLLADELPVGVGVWIADLYVLEVSCNKRVPRWNAVVARPVCLCEMADFHLRAFTLNGALDAAQVDSAHFAKGVFGGVKKPRGEFRAG